MSDNVAKPKAQASTDLKDWRSVLAYVQEHGRKLGKSKMFEDIKRGRLKRKPDGMFRQVDVKRYMVSLPMLGTSDAMAERVADRQRRKEEEEIRRLKADADAREFNLEVLKGRYVLKEKVHLELAARAVTLASGLKTAFEATQLDLVSLVDGNPKKVSLLMEKLEDILDIALNEYSREMEFEVLFDVEEPEFEPELEPVANNAQTEQPGGVHE